MTGKNGQKNPKVDDYCMQFIYMMTVFEAMCYNTHLRIGVAKTASN